MMDKNVVIIIAIVLVIAVILYCSRGKKEGFDLDEPTINNDGVVEVMQDRLSGYQMPDNSTLLPPAPPGQTVKSADQFAKSFFFGTDHSRYDFITNDPDNVLNTRSAPVDMAPNVDLPLGGGPEAFNAQRHEYRQLRKNLGYNNRLVFNNPMDLFGSPVAETLYRRADNDEPLQSMFNNPRDLETGMLARLDRIKARRDFNNGTESGINDVVVPAYGVNDLPLGARTASFSPVTGTLQLNDSREVKIPSMNGAVEGNPLVRPAIPALAGYDLDHNGVMRL